MSPTRKLSFPKKIIFENFKPDFRKSYCSSAIDCKMTVGKPGESAQHSPHINIIANFCFLRILD